MLRVHPNAIHEGHLPPLYIYYVASNFTYYKSQPHSEAYFKATIGSSCGNMKSAPNGGQVANTLNPAELGVSHLQRSRIGGYIAVQRNDLN